MKAPPHRFLPNREALGIIAAGLEELARSAGVLTAGELRGVITTAGAAQAPPPSVRS